MLDWLAFAPGAHRVGCPVCRRGERDQAAGLKVEPDGAAVLHCFRCGLVETYRPARGITHRAPAVRSAIKPAAPERDTLSDWGRALWAACLPISGVAQHYLQYRRCVIPPADGDLRWHPSVKHPSGHVGPALVALITHALTGAPTSLHRTWITPTGKASVSPARLLLAGHPTKSGIIRLWPDEFVTTSLAVAEGIETALSVAHAFEPAWATIDAGHLAEFPVLAGVEVLTIARDNDQAGIKAAQKCTDRWANAGCIVRVTRQVANDFNDILTRTAA